MKKKFSSYLLFISVLLFIAYIITSILSSKKDNKEKRDEIIKVGVILPLTGDAAVYGNSIKSGIELASKNINNIETIYEDGKGNPKDALFALNKLLSKNKVDIIIGGAMSNVANALIPVCTKEKKVIISPTATLPSLTKYGNYFFRLWPSDTYDGKIMAHFMIDSLNIFQTGVFYVNSDYGVGIKDVFENEFSKKGGDILLSESYQLGQSDFRTQLNKFKKKGVKNIYIPGYYKELSNIFIQMRELNYKPKIFGPQSFKSDELLKLAGNIMEGCVFTYPKYNPTDVNNLRIKRFVNEYKKEYNKIPDIYAVQGYDAISLIISIIKDNSSKPINFQKELLKIKNYSGISGKFSFLPNGDIEKELDFYTVKDAKFIKY